MIEEPWKPKKKLVNQVIQHPASKVVFIVGGVAVTVALLGLFFKLFEFTARNYKNLQETMHRKI